MLRLFKVIKMRGCVMEWGGGKEKKSFWLFDDMYYSWFFSHAVICIIFCLESSRKYFILQKDLYTNNRLHAMCKVIALRINKNKLLTFPLFRELIILFMSYVPGRTCRRICLLWSVKEISVFTNFLKSICFPRVLEVICRGDNTIHKGG